jgi:hypothetical protein
VRRPGRLVPAAAPMPAIRPSVSTSCTGRPSSRACRVIASTSLALPSYRNWFINA